MFLVVFVSCLNYNFALFPYFVSVDATAESGRLGRLINHSRNGNCTTKVIGIGGRPHLLLMADQNIKEGTDLLCIQILLKFQTMDSYLCA